MLDAPMPIAVLRRLAQRRNACQVDPRRDELASIADGLEAMIAEGAFGLCFEHVRNDMVGLAAKLRQLAET